MKSIVVFISGRGSNLKSLIENQEHYKITHVFSNNSSAPGLKIAESENIPCKVYTCTNKKQRNQQEEFFLKELAEIQPDLIVLAGFMQMLSKNFVEQWFGKIINLHPSLLPKFQGLDTHQKALTAGEKFHGASIHFVDSGLDTGAIIAQATVPVMEGDDKQTLAERVLVKEHKILPWVINRLCTDDIKFNSGRVYYNLQALEQANKFSFKLFGEVYE